MASRLTIFPNNPSGEPEDQFKNINLALQSLDDWSKRISTEVVLNFVDDSAQSTNSRTYTALQGFTQVFNVAGTLIRYDLSLNIASGGTTGIAVFLDGEAIKQVSDSVSGGHLVYLTDTLNVSSGQHTIQVQWKSTSNTVQKIENGGSSLVVTSLI